MSAMPGSTSARLSALEDQVGSIEVIVAENNVLTRELHAAVCGDGSRGSTVRERLASLEASNDWRHRGAFTAAMGIVSAAFAYLAHALSTIEHP